MKRHTKYSKFITTEPYTRLALIPNSEGQYEEKQFTKIKCWGCNEIIGESTTSTLSSHKASICKKHIPICPKLSNIKEPNSKYQKTQSEQAVPSPPKDTDLVTIYKLVFLPESRVVYVGRTKDLAHRLAKHSSPSSGCRLVRNAIRRYGRKKFGIEPIMWCHPEDADANESFYIIENNTLHPNGYNLRHGAAAGIEIDETTALTCTSGAIVPFESDADEAMAMQEAWGDVAEMLKAGPEDTLAEAHLRDLIRSVHPDHAGDRTFSASEVTAMLNSLHDTMRETSA